MKFTQKFFCTALVFFLGVIISMPVNSAFAQAIPGTEQQQPEVREDFTDDELKLFLKANKSVAMVQQEAEQKMIQAIEEEEMDINRFNEIANAQQNPQAEPDVSEDEMATFTKAAEKVMAVQRETQSEVAAAVESEGMEFTDYREIMMAYQSSPVVQEKLTKLIEEEQGQNPDPDNQNN
ncbi:DUF4168 domain-containing protein [Catalinimonas niigatensis]|uniref:DUF4168 domain-containing protein n=1 Tax=Catalinimonas niigatensis TaxID=1397264 RepID=UPI0026652743|nr:DUF4168 domain-containing protein [Catalinimonas niigatensis]WPP48425.1 DUF4168 domain-containing protein [Catalinimonas niigatensis]